MSVHPSTADELQLDFSGGRSGDWRRAPLTWQPYHPSHDDYQARGNCRRWIARCLNMGTRAYLLSIAEVEKAFEEAADGKPVVLSFASHDFRDLREDVIDAYEMLNSVSKNFPNVEFRFCEAIEAMRKSLQLPDTSPCELQISFEKINSCSHIMHVISNNPTFGSQPFLAIKTKEGNYYHDNFDFQEPFHEWSYVFDKETLEIDTIDKIGVATNNEVGITSIVTFDPHSKETQTKYLNTN